MRYITNKIGLVPAVLVIFYIYIISRVQNAMKNIKGKTTVIKITKLLLFRNPELWSTGDEALDDVTEFKRTFPLIKSAACSATPYPAEANYEQRWMSSAKCTDRKDLHEPQIQTERLNHPRHGHWLKGIVRQIIRGSRVTSVELTNSVHLQICIYYPTKVLWQHGTCSCWMELRVRAIIIIEQPFFNRLVRLHLLAWGNLLP